MLAFGAYEKPQIFVCFNYNNYKTQFLFTILKYYFNFFKKIEFLQSFGCVRNLAGFRRWSDCGRLGSGDGLMVVQWGSTGVLAGSYVSHFFLILGIYYFFFLNRERRNFFLRSYWSSCKVFYFKKKRNPPKTEENEKKHLTFPFFKQI